MELTLKTSYLSIADKTQICEMIKNNSIKYENGMAFIDNIAKCIAIDIAILQFYFEVDIDNVDVDELYANDTIEYAKTIMPISELEFIKDNADSMIKQEVDVYNSLAGVLNRNLENLISKAPSSRQISTWLNKLPKVMKEIDPNTLEVLKGVMQGELDTPKPKKVK